MSRGTSRRSFIKHIAYAGATLPVVLPTLARAKSANSKLDLAFVATGGKAQVHLDTAAKFGHNCVAFTDVDKNAWGNAAKHWSDATAYDDYRKMFDKEGGKIDAVHVTTPDHHHFPAAAIALQQARPIHLYVQKPLTWSVWEARKLAEMAREKKVATQMGNQGHAAEGWRLVCEWIWQGAIGDVKEVHNWTNRPIWPQGRSRPKNEEPVPANLNWDCWIGPAPMRPYSSEAGPGKSNWAKYCYHPFAWRGWFDFGAGALGDMACHTMDGQFWALGTDSPISVEPLKIVDITDEQFPNQSILKWEYAANDKRPAYTAYWYDGGLFPEKPDNVRKLPNTGNLFIGTKGTILVAGDYGNSPRIVPEELMQQVGKPKPMIERAPDSAEYTGNKKLGHFEDNHHLEFYMAAAGEKPIDFPKSNFSYAAPMTESIQLGNVALRAGTKIEWDGKNMKITNVPDANRFINREPRAGWKVV
ncbi:MAG: gfo/Idh/MocA family oxidoreductase [Phycisphaera sp.]|nr:gfo/Idh/MocA family oxidoreductase [Phycisphaera sp.]